MYRIDNDGVISMIRGDTASFDIIVYTENDQGELVEYELEPGDRLDFTVKKSTKVEEKLISKIANEQSQHIVIDPSDTEGLKYGTYKYDIQFTSASGLVDTIIPPTDFNILEEVTW